MIRLILVLLLMAGSAMAVEKSVRNLGMGAQQPNPQGWTAQDPTAQAIIDRPPAYEELYDLVDVDLKRLRGGQMSQDEFNQKWMRGAKK